MGVTWACDEEVPQSLQWFPGQGFGVDVVQKFFFFVSHLPKLCHSPPTETAMATGSESYTRRKKDPCVSSYCRRGQ